VLRSFCAQCKAPGKDGFLFMLIGTRFRASSWFRNALMIRTDAAQADGPDEVRRVDYWLKWPIGWHGVTFLHARMRERIEHEFDPIRNAQFVIDSL
jgi:hypothetical protein